MKPPTITPRRVNKMIVSRNPGWNRGTTACTASVTSVRPWCAERIRQRRQPIAQKFGRYNGTAFWASWIKRLTRVSGIYCCRNSCASFLSIVCIPVSARAWSVLMVTSTVAGDAPSSIRSQAYGCSRCCAEKNHSAGGKQQLDESSVESGIGLIPYYFVWRWDCS